MVRYTQIFMNGFSKHSDNDYLLKHRKGKNMKRRLKIILDILMLLVVLTLFNKQLVSMKYHEVAGIVLLALMILHIAVNIRIAAAMCKKFRKVPAAIKAGLVVDILLLLCFAGLGISGILISRTVLTGISSRNMMFKLLHMFTGGLSVILLGVHIGLHICHLHMPMIPALIISAAILCVGAYGLTSTGEVRWLSMPFAAAAQPGGMERREEGFAFGGEGMENNKPERAGKGEHMNGRSGQGNGRQPSGGGGNHMSLSAVQRFQSVAAYAGMMLSCTALTYWIAAIGKKKHIIGKS